ncbi:MAG: polyphenol oxidase family protein [Verrucomicrobiales bacterium]|nr:polyphenol oxidase family protein [Verrucomicrobiales bacterium]
MRTKTEKELIRRNPGSPPYLEFAPLQVPQLRHRFALRGEPHEALPNPPHFPPPPMRHVQAEQVHGNLAVGVTSRDHDRIIPSADALVTADKNLTLIIRTADCGPVYFYDPVNQAIGLAHSGKKGTVMNITAQVIRLMSEQFSSKPEDLVVVLGPCIRPPDYEIDFAEEIAAQAKAEGVRHYHDCGLNTATNLTEFYSYRMEQGRTGRHYAFLMLND